MQMNEKYSVSDHTFVVCAYGESEFLESCVRSVAYQSIPVKVIIATSTPNELITGIATKYRLPVFVRSEGENGIAADWNFALSCADTPLVTIAHQDDIYHSHYAEEILKAANTSEHPLIVFSDYAELRGKETWTGNKNLYIKRFLLLPLRSKKNRGSIFWRRRALSLGNPICCPAVTYAVENLPKPIFENNMKSNIDWQAWERLSSMKGDFIYLTQPLMKHRIHEESTTSKLIEDDGRKEEDIQVFVKFWPRWVAKILEKFYAGAEKSNKV